MWLAAAAASLAMWPPAVRAQEHLTIRSDLLFYGDNTEFHNPFREGETIFGAAVRLAADIEVNHRVRVSLGGFGNQRFGSEQSFEIARPLIALTVAGRRSEFVFGTLPVGTKPIPAGPDRQGPHGLAAAAAARDAGVRPACTKPACSGDSPAHSCPTRCGSCGSS